MQMKSQAAPAGPDIVPLSSRLGYFFLFPFEPSILILLAGLSLASLLYGLIPLTDPLDFLVAESIIALIAFRHAFRVMHRTSMGLLSSEQHAEARDDSHRTYLPWKLLAIVVIWAALIAILTDVNKNLGTLVRLFVDLAFPASVMALSASNSFSQGVNPLAWIRIIRRVGRTYIALVLVVLPVFVGAGVARPLMFAFRDFALTLSLENFVLLYFNLVAFNMMGYALYQHHGVLGMEVTGTLAQGRFDLRPDPGEDLEEVNRLVAAGDLEGAIDALYDRQRIEPENVAVQERYHELLVKAAMTRRAIDHGNRYLGMLMRTAQADRGVDVFRRLQRLNPDFALADPGQVLPLAQAALDRGDPTLALTLMRSFDKRHPGHGDTAAIYLLSARILSEHFEKHDMAVRIVRAMRSKFPDHPLAAQAAKLQRALEAGPLAAR